MAGIRMKAGIQASGFGPLMKAEDLLHTEQPYRQSGTAVLLFHFF
jgi:hypothetical protein